MVRQSSDILLGHSVLVLLVLLLLLLLLSVQQIEATL